VQDITAWVDFTRVADAALAAGLLIVIAGIFERRHPVGATVSPGHDLNAQRAGVIGAVQGLCLPFRGFSRSGATISTGLLLGVVKARAEAFSFALAVVLTPPVVVREVLRLVRAAHEGGADLRLAALESVLGAVVAFFAGLLALRWLSRWLEGGRWYWFGVYCLVAAGAVMLLHRAGY